MKSKLFKVLVFWIVTGSACIFSGAASAGLDDALDEMFKGVVVTPSLSDNARQKVVSGGQIRLRAPNRRYNIVSFNPPRLTAGCGGIDIYGGSFSFINAEEFRALLRQIGSNALGYAFNLAISAICGDCMAIMNDLQKKISALNEHLADTCQLAKGITTHAFDSMGATASNMGVSEAEWQSSLGTFDDILEATLDVTNISPGRAANQNNTRCPDGDEDCKNNPNSSDNNDNGNKTAKSLFMMTSEVASIAGLTSKEQKELLLNILGFRIITAEDDTKNAAYFDKSGTIQFHDLVSGKFSLDTDGKKKQVYKCNKVDPAKPNEICITPTLEDWSFLGTEGHVNKSMFGKAHETSTAANEQASPSIEEAFGQGRVGELQQNEQRFIMATNSIYLRPLMRVQGNEEHVKQINHVLKPLYVSSLTVKLAESIIEIKNTFQSETKNFKLNDEQKVAWNIFIEEYRKMKAIHNELEGRIMRDVEKTVQAIKNGGS